MGQKPVDICRSSHPFFWEMKSQRPKWQWPVGFTNSELTSDTGPVAEETNFSSKLKVKRLGLCVPERDTIQWPFNLRVQGFSCIWPRPHRSWHRGKNLPGICPRKSWCITGGYWESNSFRPQYRIPTMTSKWKTQLSIHILFMQGFDVSFLMFSYVSGLRHGMACMAWWHGMSHYQWGLKNSMVGSKLSLLKWWYPLVN